MKTQEMKDFMRTPSPANAIRLAIADHMAFAAATPFGTDWEFVTALQTALDIVEKHQAEKFGRKA